MKAKLFFIGLVLTLLFIPSFIDLNAAWAGPCGPAGSCNSPAPITVEGGTINSGYSLTVKGNTAKGDPAGENSTFDTVIGGEDGFLLGSKINVSEDADYVTQLIYQKKDSCSANMDNCFNEYSQETAYFNYPIYAADGLALAPGEVITFPLNSGIYIEGGLEGKYGFGLYARAAELNHTTLTGYDSGAVEVKNSSAVWGASAGKDATSDWYSGDTCSTSTGYEFDEANICAYSYGGFFQGFTSRGIALHTRSYNSAYGAYFRGTVLVASSLVTTSNVYNDVIPYRYKNSGIYPELIIKTANTLWNDPGYDGTPSTYEEYEVLKVDSTDPKKLQIGGSDTDYEICLNNDCIDSWPSGGGGSSQSFKFVDVPSGNDPQADSSADTLQFLNGDNISITGSNDDKVTFAVNGTLNNIERINGKNGDQLIIDPDDDEGLLIYDKVYIDDLGQNCSKVITVGNNRLSCGTDAVNDADYSPSNELQNIDEVLGQGSITTKTITIGELCINNTCINESQLKLLLKLVK